MRRIVVSIISVVLVLSLMLSSLPKANAEELFLDLEGLLPSKEDDPFSYPILQEPEWYFGNSWFESLDDPGFLEGRGVEYYKRFFAHSDMSVEFHVYLFSSVSAAETSYDEMVNVKKSEGGYTEIPLPNGFAVVYDFGTYQSGFSLGVIVNVLFRVEVHTGQISEDPTDQLMVFTSLERARIVEKIATVIPEFPASHVSFLILASLVMATLFSIRFPKANRKIERITRCLFGCPRLK